MGRMTKVLQKDTELDVELWPVSQATTEKDVRKSNKYCLSAGVQPQLIQGIRRRDGIGKGQGTTA